MRKKIFLLMTLIVLAVLFLLSFQMFRNRNSGSHGDIIVPVDDGGQPDDVTQDPVEPPVQQESYLDIEAVDDGEVIFHSYEDYYRYGPSIIEYEDGSMDAWFSAPGNSGSQWDWITYRHSDDGVNWGPEQVVLRPTPGSKDQCSVCDPAVIYFNGYYYLGYTGTYDYEREGMNNSAFVARSQYPDGPFEKWNGSGWGGYPEPIIEYTGDPEGWGIGELSFVIHDDDLCVYYSYIDTRENSIRLHKADLTDDWPLTLRYKSRVVSRDEIDSLDVVYDDRLQTFLGFSITGRMSDSSRVIMFESFSGKGFDEMNSTKTYIEEYAHNLGIAKSPEGHIDSGKEILIGYAFGENWGRWDLKMQKFRIIER